MTFYNKLRRCALRILLVTFWLFIMSGAVMFLELVIDPKHPIAIKVMMLAIAVLISLGGSIGLVEAWRELT